jgi:hypothetical protein
MRDTVRDTVPQAVQLAVVSSGAECSSVREAALGGAVRSYLEERQGAVVSSTITGCTSISGVSGGRGRGTVGGEGMVGRGKGNRWSRFVISLGGLAAVCSVILT